MVRVKYVVVLLFLLFAAATNAQNVRGFYLEGTGSWLGNTTKENQILSYAQGNGYNYINFYDLNDINWSNATQKNQLASFMSRGRTQYGITEFGAIVETYSSAVNEILPYNNSRSNANEKFNIINLEFEYWVSSSISASYCSRYLSPNGYNCDTAGAYKFAWKQFKQIDSLCGANNLISEFYLGWPNRGQMEQIGNSADRILLHAYRPTDSDVYSYSKTRLSWLGQMSSPKKVIVLFSSESSFMGPWLASHPITRPYQTYSSDLSSETASWKNNIDLKGYHWFTYDHMPQTIIATATITASGPLSFCSGGNVTLTANSGSAYLWSPGGATTRSITVSTAGSYTVRVTNAGGTNVTSMPTVVALSTTGITPTVTVTGQSSCSNATLTSSTASAYHWSNGETTQSISVSNSGSYTVTTGTGTCVATSSPANVTVNPPPATPVISASGSLSICQGTQLTLTSSTANGYLWSNGATTRSIVVSSGGNYSVTVYSGPNCSAQSAISSVYTLSNPTTPTITPGSSTTLSTSNPSVTLTSSASNNNQWSTGATTNAITVNIPGTYRVTVSSASGCSATSNPLIIDGTGCVPPPVPTISSISTVISPGQTLVLTASSGNGYLWSTGATTQSITINHAGDYSVRVYASAGCFSESDPITISAAISTGISDLSSKDDNTNFTLYPNPANYFFNIEFTLNKHKDVQLNLTDVIGRTVLYRLVKGVPGVNKIEVKSNDLSRGIYFANLTCDDQRQMIKVVIE